MIFGEMVTTILIYALIKTIQTFTDLRAGRFTSVLITLHEMIGRKRGEIAMFEKALAANVAFALVVIRTKVIEKLSLVVKRLCVIVIYLDIRWHWNVQFTYIIAPRRGGQHPIMTDSHITHVGGTRRLGLGLWVREGILAISVIP